MTGSRKPKDTYAGSKLSWELPPSLSQKAWENAHSYFPSGPPAPNYLCHNKSYPWGLRVSGGHK